MPNDEVTFVFQGIRRTHHTTTVPRPLNINILEIDLNCPAIGFLVTPGGSEYDDPNTEIQEEVLARRTTTFVADYGLQIGINGDFAAPAQGPHYEYQPRVLLGLAVSDGVQYSTDDGRPALTLPRDPRLGRAYIGRAPFPDDVYNAIGGNKMVVEGGLPVEPSTWDPIGGALDLSPRTGVGVSADGKKLVIIVIDGRKPWFSEGVTLPEIAEYLIEFGAHAGLNLDGGGSSTMALAGECGPTVINYPSDAAGERVVSNHLGIFSAPTMLYVDGEAPNDPGPNTSAISDPGEDGSLEHPFDMIQEAIDASCDGTTVIVRAGRYFENINLLGKNITVTSWEPPEPYVVSDTVIDGNNLGPVVTFESGEGPGCTLSGLVLTRGRGMLAGAIYCHGSSPTISNCLLVGNRVLSDSGGVVACWNSTCVLHNCTISDNVAGTDGGAIYCLDSNVAVRDSIVWETWANDIYVQSGLAPEVAYSTVLGGWAGASGYEMDPCFVRPGYWASANDPSLPVDPNTPDAIWIAGDYHLKSQGGRWDPSVQEWVLDDVTSPAVDAGDPDSGWIRELWPHGRRANIGAFGGTSEASMSLSDVGNIADLNDDHVVDHRDLILLMDHWLVEQVPLKADLDRNGLVDFGDVAVLGASWFADATPADIGEGPAPPINLAAEPGDSWISLNWDDNVETDLAGYNVYRSLSSGSGYVRVNRRSLVTDSEYADTDVTSGVTYYYVVTAENTSGYESAYSDEVSASLGVRPVMKLLAGVGVRTMGVDVSRWQDQAGNNDAGQLVSEDRPELILSAINGEPAIEFDGVGEHLDVANSTDINVGGPYSGKTLVVVFKTGSNVTSRQVIWEQGGDTRGLSFYLDNGKLYITGWNLLETPWMAMAPSTPVSADTAYVATLVMDAFGGEFEGFVNGVSIGSVGQVTWLYAHSGACALGHVEGRTRFHDGLTAGPANFGGQIAEFHMYNDVLSESDRQTLEDALMSKYGAEAVPEEETLVEVGSTWNYLDNGSDQGTAWYGIGFDDSGWASGPAELGYGDGDEVTLVSFGTDPNNRYTTTYFRHMFSVSDPSKYQNLILRVLRDDGAVVYLNGTEVLRTNMPEGTITYTTLASSPVDGPAEDEFVERIIDPSHLAVGTNLLAVEVHQNQPGSPDISFDLTLVGTPSDVPGAVATGVRKGPYLIYPGDNTQMMVLWQLNTTQECTLEWGTDTNYGNAVISSEYGSDHQHLYTIGGLAPGVKYYYRVEVGGDYHTGSFLAASAADGESAKFLAYGDTRSNPDIHDAVNAQVIATYTADPGYQSFTMLTGDWASSDMEAAWTWEFFGRIWSNTLEMQANLPIQGCMGNHEGGGMIFEKYWPYPHESGARYWSFDCGPAHIVIVDLKREGDSLGTAQKVWLEADLAGSAKKWNFLQFHAPVYSAGGGHLNNTIEQGYIQSLCEMYGVAAVFCGHNHYYARAMVNGVAHITTGGGGAPLYSPEDGQPNIVAYDQSNHFCKIDIQGRQFTFEAVRLDGTVIDTFTMSH
ncbi:MAG: phosphodiester glycosidase family protein [Planctomycetota bacterium]